MGKEIANVRTKANGKGTIPRQAVIKKELANVSPGRQPENIRGLGKEARRQAEGRKRKGDPKVKVKVTSVQGHESTGVIQPNTSS